VKENPFLGLRHLYQEPETKAIHQQMLQWMKSTLIWVDDVLTACPPAWPEPEIRRRALYMLDEPLHVLSAPTEPPIADFLNRRIKKAVGEIESEQVTSGMTIWKLYNHGFVVKTPEVTIGFDLHQGPYETFHITTQLFDRILQATQALFISHTHKDHADAYAISRLVEMGRPVIVPPGVGQDNKWHDRLIQPERHWKVSHKLALDETNIPYRVFPGHQGVELLNNVYLVDLPHDLHIMQTGDQSLMEDFYVWIDRVQEQFEVDVLLPNCWTTDLQRMIDGTQPRLVITGHENEMAHPVDHREAFSKTYALFADEPTPVLVMAWGERYHYEKDQVLSPATSIARESAPSASGMRAAALEKRRKEPRQ
jgi:L-ascorbate metabolism protein UlaG (beta-lactamase superfamily)